MIKSSFFKIPIRQIFISAVGFTNISDSTCYSKTTSSKFSLLRQLVYIFDGKGNNIHLFGHIKCSWETSTDISLFLYIKLQPNVDFGFKIFGGDIMVIPVLYRFIQVLSLSLLSLLNFGFTDSY